MWSRPSNSRVKAVVTQTVAAIVLAALAGGAIEGHKPITSPYTYNEDVFPILRDRCARCHVSGGVAPMSLTTYKDAFPWGESIRTELVAGHMPPGSVDDAAGKFRNARALSARELNVLLTWVTGGNPMGNPEHTPPPVTPQPVWPLGPPDLVVQMPSEFTMAADTNEATQEFALPIAASGGRQVRAVDLMPGNPTIVRSATVSVKVSAAGAGRVGPISQGAAPVGSAAGRISSGPVNDGTAAPERVLAVWVPGDDPVPLVEGTAFRLPPDAELVLRVHYKKTWEHERQAMSDRTSVGLYFASAPRSEVLAWTIAPSEQERLTPKQGTGESEVGRTLLGPAGTEQLSFTRILDQNVHAIAIYPDSALANVHVAVTAVRPDGTHADLIRFRPQLDWSRRYWFADPIALPRGTRVTVTATFNDQLLPPGAAPIAAGRPDASALRLTLNVVPST